MNEKITEYIVCDILKENEGQYPKVIIEAQQSTKFEITKWLKHGSKNGLDRRTEFIVVFDKISDHLIVIEGTANLKKHESKNRDKPRDYTVNSALYSEYLAKTFGVIFIMVSRQKKSELEILVFLQLQLQLAVEELDKKILRLDIFRIQQYVDKIHAWVWMYKICPYTWVLREITKRELFTCQNTRVRTGIKLERKRGK